ncbi:MULTISPECIES: DUF805 domain-containing protein [Basfia]|nr:MULTISPECIES: DUF805 domain-containing protein [Basfia]QIM68219.1 hypothetical protein A4G13_01780 [Basfia succiniciproducens]SCX96149.1 Uncharacterized membrane protein YhaH, DUF805 family [Basfia succiniciproducens]SEQ53053.1 Uncharacterized membrane protein YhaH, DUF805 family [Basfia succiniciproducens]
MNWYLSVLKKYAVFSGRARRKEFWMFMLFTTIIGIALGVLDVLFGFYDHQTGQGFLSGIYSLAVLIPTIAVSARRLHDTDRSAWWLLLGFIPVIGILILIVFWCFDGSFTTNRFGVNPKQDFLYEKNKRTQSDIISKS